MSSHTVATPVPHASTTTHARLASASPSHYSPLFGVADAQAGTSGNVSLTSDYVFRGVSQNNQQPAPAGAWNTRPKAARTSACVGQQHQLAVGSLTSTAPISSSAQLDVLRRLMRQVQRGRELRRRRAVLLVSRRFSVRLQQRRHPRGVCQRHRRRQRQGQPGRAKYLYAATDLFGYADSDGSDFTSTSAPA